LRCHSQRYLRQLRNGTLFSRRPPEPSLNAVSEAERHESLRATIAAHYLPPEGQRAEPPPCRLMPCHFITPPPSEYAASPAMPAALSGAAGYATIRHFRCRVVSAEANNIQQDQTSHGRDCVLRMSLLATASSPYTPNRIRLRRLKKMPPVRIFR